MTMPTSLPRRFPEVRFPAEFTALYDGPFQYFGGSRLIHGAGMSVGALGGWPPEDGLADENDLFHKNHRREALQQVRGAIESRIHSRLRQMTGGSRQLRHQTLEGGCDTCDGGSMLIGVGTIEGAPVLSGRGLHGGVMRTLAGRQHVARRLTSRIGELNKVDNETWENSWVPPANRREAVTEDEQQVVLLGEALAALSDAMTSGVWDKDTTKEAKTILSILAQEGHLIPSNQITLILRQLERTLSELQAYTSTRGNSDKDKRIIRLIFTILERARSVAETLSSNADRSVEERRMVIGALKVPLSLQTEYQRMSRLGGTPLRPFGQPARPYRPGDTRNVFPVPPGRRVIPPGYAPGLGVPGNVPYPLMEPPVNLFQ